MSRIDARSLEQLFLSARSRNAWADEPISDETLREIYEILKCGPTSMNTSPARFFFVRSPEAKVRLEPHLSEGNRAKSMSAPCVVIIGTDMAFYEQLPQLFPARPQAKDMFIGKAALIEATATRNATLQGAYLMIAARAIGLDCGPMSGFDAPAVDQEFFAGTSIKSNFLCSIGRGADESFPRLPRLPFDQACTIL